MRLATYNVEWFNALFDDRGRLLADNGPSARYKTTRAEQLGALGIVFTALDADAITIIEAPDTNGHRSTVTALENFARQFDLRARQALIGFASDTEQEIACLYDPDRLTIVHDPQGAPSTSHGSSDAPRFDGTFRYDLDADMVHETIRFSKPPLEMAVTTSGGTRLRLIGVHAKSKNPYGANSREAQLRLSIENRRKQLAQCLWLRQRVEAHLAAGDSLVVMGDFNDGPGIDEFEKLFGHSGVEIVLGTEDAPRLYDPHAAMALQSRVALAPTTARFYIAPQKRFFEALLDFIMVSPDLAARQPDWRIWHPFNDPGVMAVPDLREALLQASDHFPVTIDLPGLN
ncbi:MAG: endonuclease [Tabrizicola sp.]|uniref:endonuclease/exonuclease/phosphatase family protein n=1 Tax=Tabrizicola sp. TaxID=2005166 RepID=UPI002736F5AE|nr:endonuclease/exonuclease/phosphatase family protein [Tabrizicola sp.]MDP3263668.1 endonuclease [Tabrizicola sp.]MDP3647032.1 endonuclease [Paracoccaceae bacterium]MDZ4069876.1 endonuclease [Tabrizicola sp.]